MEATPRITPLMSNAELDNWADIYVQARIGETISVPLSEFLRAPWTHLANAGQETAPECVRHGFLPLLPVQAATSKRIRDDWESISSKEASRPRLVLVAST